MAERSPTPNRLPRNFHRTFIPERQYIHALQEFAAVGGEGTEQEIRDRTGIPTGESTGKVGAIISYCLGMQLIALRSPARSAVRAPELTPFGAVVLREDPFLSEEITQWLVHLHLCSPLWGAEVWYLTFCRATISLGMRFTRQDLEHFLLAAFNLPGAARQTVVGPLFRTYSDPAALGLCGVLSETERGRVVRKPAPVARSYARPYGAWLLHLIDSHFPNQQEIPLSDLDQMTGWRSIGGWSPAEGREVLRLAEEKGAITIDRQMNPWIVRRNAAPVDYWRTIYDDLI